MLSKFTYFDIISNLFPGLFLVWALPILGPFDKSTIPLLLTDNMIVDPILLIAICYITGQFLQFISKYSIEPLLKTVYWSGYFFSDIFLILSFRKCPQIELSRYISCAENMLGFSREDLSILLDEGIKSDKRKLQKAIEISGAIYRIIDTDTRDSSKAENAHLQNTFYSLFRNLTSIFLILIISNLIGAIKLYGGVAIPVGTVIVNIILMSICFIQSKEKGELYVRGLFWSFCR